MGKSVCFIVSFLGAALFCMMLPGMAVARPSILVLPKNDVSHFWSWIKQGALDAGQERNADVIYFPPSLPYDPDTQREHIEKAISRKIDAIVIAPDQLSSTAEELALAAERDIKIVIIDSATDFKGYVSFIASDNYAAGRKAAKHLLSYTNPGERILLIRYRRNNASTMKREKGFFDALSSLSASVMLVEVVYVNANEENAYRNTLMALEKYPGIAAIFSPGEATTTGALRAVKELGLTGKTILVGFDYTKELHAALEEGSLQALMIQDPYTMGYLGVMAACDAIQGKPVKRKIITDTILATEGKDVPAYMCK